MLDSIRCADRIDFMRGISAGAVDLIVTSPPYNIGKEYERRTSLGDYIDHQTETITEAVRLLSPTGSICWQVGNYVDAGEVFPLDAIFYPIFKSHGLKMRNRIIWTFGHGLHCRHRFSGRHEAILWFTKADNYVFNLDPVRVPSKYPNKKHFKGPNKGALSGNPLGKNPSDVWDIVNIKSNHPEKTAHPCQFPEELVERLVLALSPDDGLVLDPYLGSGTTCAVAARHGRRFMGCDTDDEYVRIATDRVSRVFAAAEAEESRALAKAIRKGGEG